MATQKKIDKAILECYNLLFKHSEPSADFNELMAKATINEFGQKEIKFNDYEIEETKFNTIVADIVSKYKFKDYLKQAFRNTILLGCSPKFKKK